MRTVNRLKYLRASPDLSNYTSVCIIELELMYEARTVMYVIVIASVAQLGLAQGTIELS